MKVNLILACDSNYGIGIKTSNYSLPWNIPPDMKFFTKITQNTCILMGRHTWDSIPIKNRALKNRLNIVLSKTYNEYTISSQNKTGAECYLVKSIEEFFEIYKLIGNNREIFIIGGAELYKYFLYNNTLIKTIYLTKINHNYNCNIIFPDEYMNFLSNNVSITQLESDTTIDKSNNIYVNYKILKIDFINDNTNTNELTNMLPITKSINNLEELKYLELLQQILNEGEERITRNGSTLSLFSGNLEFDLSNNTLPIITTRKIFTRGIFEELMWFIRGQTDSKILEAKGINIWKGNTSKEFLANRNLSYDEGKIGPMYGYQWRNYGLNYNLYLQDPTNKGYNQLDELLKGLINDKFSRRHIMTTYNPKQVQDSVLPPCHGIVTQFYVSKNDEIDMKVYCRSSDMFHGLPFNITSYCLLLHLIGKVCNYKPRKVYFTLGDIHIYSNHIDSVKLLLEREPYSFPTINIKKQFDSNDLLCNLESFEYNDIEIINYQSHPSIKVDMVV